jgi:hypothetical protein
VGKQQKQKQQKQQESCAGRSATLGARWRARHLEPAVARACLFLKSSLARAAALVAALGWARFGELVMSSQPSSARQPRWREAAALVAALR